MEARDMANPEGARHRILGIDVSRKHPAVPKPKAERTFVPEPGKLPTKKSLIRRLANNLTVRIAFAGLSLASGGLAIQHYIEKQGDISLPGITRDISSIPEQGIEDIQRLFGKSSSEVPSTFDSTKNNGVLGDNNILDVSLETVQNSPNLDPDGNLLVYIAPPKPGKSVIYNVNTNVVKISPGDHYDENNALAITTTTLIEEINANNPFPMPFDGPAQEYTDEKGNFLAIWVYFTDLTGIERRLSIVPQDTRITPLLDLPKVNPSNYTTGERISLKRGTLLFNPNVNMDIWYSNSIEARDGLPTTFTFKPLTVQNESGQTKIPRTNEASSP